MLPVLVIVLAVGSSQAATTCSPASLASGPCLNTLCPTGFTCTSAIMCCPTANVVTVTTTNLRTTTAACVDKINPSTGTSDCTKMAAYCTNPNYYTLMTTQCPRTCGRCSSSVTTASSACVDLVNAATGVSDCTSRRQYCTNSVYLTLMRQQCPRTCGFCSG